MKKKVADDDLRPEYDAELILGGVRGKYAARYNDKSPALSGEQERKRTTMQLAIEIEQEDDGRWLAEVPSLPGVLAYGATRREAIDHVQALALRVLADRLDQGEAIPEISHVFAVSP